MTAEIHILIAAQDHQAASLAEADARRLIRSAELQGDGPARPATRRLAVLLRRLAGAPSFA